MSATHSFNADLVDKKFSDLHAAAGHPEKLDSAFAQQFFAEVNALDGHEQMASGWLHDSASSWFVEKDGFMLDLAIPDAKLQFLPDGGYSTNIWILDGTCTYLEGIRAGAQNKYELYQLTNSYVYLHLRDWFSNERQAQFLGTKPVTLLQPNQQGVGKWVKT